MEISAALETFPKEASVCAMAEAVKRKPDRDLQLTGGYRTHTLPYPGKVPGKVSETPTQP
jgi:hypothetical protein